MPDQDSEELEDTHTHESVRAKGTLSRKRTVVDKVEVAAGAPGAMIQGTVIAVRGTFVEVDDGKRVRLCTVRRVLRTRLTGQRHPVVVGDKVAFAAVGGGKDAEGVIEQVHPRRTALHRSDGRKTQILAANVDQVLLVSSIREPMIKPHLIDRYLVAIHAGDLPAIICINKVDLDRKGETDEILDRYRCIGYACLATSVPTNVGIEPLREMLRDRMTMLAGQSGVGKSTLINAIQPGLNLKTAYVSISTEKGRHTTTTACWYTLDMGGAIIDTPGIRALDVAMVPLQEIEMHFVEFLDRIPQCHFPNCVHIHEAGCAVQAAVEAGEIDPSRYESYVEMFMERNEGK